MIRFRDAIVLAHTKLRVRRIRTGIAVGVSGLLFGLLLFVVIVAQGVFDSIDRFSDEGLNDRTILQVTRSGGAGSFNLYDERHNQEFIAEVRVAHDQFVKRKQAAAKKYDISYDPKTEDPSPIGIDPDTKQPAISDAGYSSDIVNKAAAARSKAEYKPFDIKKYIHSYKSARVLGEFMQVAPSDGYLSYMKDNKEKLETDADPSRLNKNIATDDSQALTVLEGSLTKPFISSKNFDAKKGEIPVVLPYSHAEKLLGLKKLDADASNEQRVQRLAEVRERISEVKASFCYRNEASQSRLAEATMQVSDIKRNQTSKDYQRPSVIYKLPSENDCGAVTITSDTRTAAEKKQATQRELYEKEIGTWPGDPQQQKITVRGVGVSSDFDTSGSVWSISEFIKSMLGSHLGYEAWAIPADLLAQVPLEYRPNAVFEKADNLDTSGFFMYETHLVEFADKVEARQLLEKTGGIFGGYGDDDVSVLPFGSGILFVDELRRMFIEFMVWVFVAIGSVALIILGAIIGRTIADGRRESAVFRAIGARRVDIGVIYGTYALLLSLRVALFALLLGVLGALIIHVAYGEQATFGAQLAYAASDTSVQFSLFSLATWYIPLIILAIVGVGMLSSLIPILLGARRNPIRDMRDDT